MKARGDVVLPSAHRFAAFAQAVLRRQKPPKVTMMPGTDSWGDLRSLEKDEPNEPVARYVRSPDETSQDEPKETPSEPSQPLTEAKKSSSRECLKLYGTDG